MAYGGIEVLLLLFIISAQNADKWPHLCSRETVQTLRRRDNSLVLAENRTAFPEVSLRRKHCVTELFRVLYLGGRNLAHAGIEVAGPRFETADGRMWREWSWLEFFRLLGNNAIDP
jgi:hypothetical protein